MFTYKWLMTGFELEWRIFDATAMIFTTHLTLNTVWAVCLNKNFLTPTL